LIFPSKKELVLLLLLLNQIVLFSPSFDLSPSPFVPLFFFDYGQVKKGFINKSVSFLIFSKVGFWIISSLLFPCKKVCFFAFKAAFYRKMKANRTLVIKIPY